MRRVVLLVVFGVLLGALLTGIAGALPGSPDLNALTWMGTVSTAAALVVAVGIYRVQQTRSDVAHQELLDALKAEDEILEDLTDTTAPSESPPPAKEDDTLTGAHREDEARYGDRSIDAAWKLGAGRGDRPRLVRLGDGTLVTVFSGGRGGRGVRVREVNPRRERSRPSRDRRSRGPESP